jgi:uncharacterized phage-associated protein
VTTSALNVAAALLQRKRAGQVIDQMKLHKLLYYVQAGSLAWFETPAYDEEIQAWTWGPVTRRVAGHYKHFDRQPIPEPVSGDAEALDDRTTWLVDRVLSEYGDLSGPALAKLTKEPGSPWNQVRGDLPEEAPSTDEIPFSLISEFHRRHGVLPSMPTERETALAERFLEGDNEALVDLIEESVGIRPTVE